MNNYIEKPLKLETTFLSFLVPIHDVLSLQFISSKNKYWKHTEIHGKSVLGSRPPSRLYFWFLINLLSLHVILVQAKTNSGKYRKQTGNTLGTNTRKQKPLGSKPPSSQMFEILLQECALIKNKQTCFLRLKKIHEQKHQNIWTNIWKIRRKTF